MNAIRFPLRTVFVYTAIGALVAGATFLWWPLDGIGGIVCRILMEEDTVWASGYSDEGFRSVRLGMTRSEVHNLLGPPIESTPWEGQSWENWTYSPADTNYQVRDVVFKDDVVVRKISEYWVE
jgi:outer membrane protein assembly factor BamE (lipoprotein component of BamABCDE complex)